MDAPVRPGQHSKNDGSTTTRLWRRNSATTMFSRGDTTHTNQNGVLVARGSDRDPLSL